MSIRVACHYYTYPAAHDPALHDVDLEVRHGEVVGIAGRDDAGKSTLCRLAAGLAPAVTGGDLVGTLEIDGHNAGEITTADLTNFVGYVSQSPRSQISGMSRDVLEEVGFAAFNAGKPRSEVERLARDAIALVGIERLANRDPLHLSGGETQLVVVAAALAMQPDHLVLDEPTAELDPGGTEVMIAALARIAAAGTALLIAEQRSLVLDSLCERLVVLDGGTVAASGTKDEVYARPDLEQMGIEIPARHRLAALAAASGMALDDASVRRLLAIGASA